METKKAQRTPERPVGNESGMGAGKRSSPKGVLVISVGLSPQVVTETVYALAWERRERIDEIYMWTTTDGAREIERTLIDGGRGALYQLYADYGIPPAAVYVKVFGRVADAPRGLSLPADRPIGDICSREDNQLVADTLMHFFQEQASDPARRLFCSLAGARKTIGPYFALALQFFGRAGDQLFHVLVPPALEADRSFFYPRPGSAPGMIQLVEVPVALLREHLDVLQGSPGPLSYSELVRQVQEELAQLKEPPVLQVQSTSSSLEVLIGNSHLPLSGLQLALYVALVARRARCAPDCPGCPRCFVSVSEVQDAKLYRPLRRLIAKGGFRDYRLERLSRWSEGESSIDERLQAFRQTMSRLNSVIGDRPGRRIYRVTRTQWGGTSNYGIAISPRRIAVPPEILAIWDC